MDSEELEKISKLLDEVPSLHEAFGADPQVALLPSAQDKSKRFLFVGLFIHEKALNRESLASICSRTITELTNAKAVAKADGVEIMMCVARGETAEPVLRLSVQAQALQKAEFLSATDLDKKEPAPGINCALYRRTIS